MKLNEIVARAGPRPPLWSGDYKIPWDEPGFSRRMLELHLSQDHDWASRRLETIDAHISWLHNKWLASEPSRILDLACGPGLYSHRLAQQGHECHGIDFSPASIEYAKEHIPAKADATFTLGDLRKIDFGTGYDAAIMIYGEFNAFPRADALTILKKAHAALKPGGRFLAEAHTFDEIRRIGKATNNWYTAENGLFSEEPHICLVENHWHENEQTAEATFYVITADSGDVTVYRNTLLGYTQDDYRALLADAGFEEIQFLSAWSNAPIKDDDQFLLLSASRPEAS